MESIGAYLSTFSESFKTALIAWPLLSLLLTLPIFAYLYRRDGRLMPWHAILAYVVVLYLTGLAYFTLYPLPSGDSGPGITYGIPPQLNPLNFVNSIATDGLQAVFELAFNVVLFVPLGFMLKVFLKLGPWATLGITLGATCLIEIAQLTGIFGLYPFAYRTFDVNDIIGNTMGGMIGWLLGKQFAKAFPEPMHEKLAKTNDPGLARRLAALWIDSMIMIAGTTFPYLIISLAYELVAGIPFEFVGFDAGQTSELMFLVCFAISFAFVEIVIPWRHGGSTLGGMFVRMSFETRPRSGRSRIAFYVARSATLFAVFAFPRYLLIVLVLFYLVTKKMPYDFIGAGASAT